MSPNVAATSEPRRRGRGRGPHLVMTALTHMDRMAGRKGRGLERYSQALATECAAVLDNNPATSGSLCVNQVMTGCEGSTIEQRARAVALSADDRETDA